MVVNEVICLLICLINLNLLLLYDLLLESAFRLIYVTEACNASARATAPLLRRYGAYRADGAVFHDGKLLNR